MTPKDATKTTNHIQVKANLELKRKHTRIYPDINVGDYVKVYNKKDKLDKERIPVWSKANFKVESINESMSQDFYKLEGRPRELMRFEILLVN
jgi:vacuolar-type H+-ATPase catalytic subunit A/Vma1